MGYHCILRTNMSSTQALSNKVMKKKILVGLLITVVLVLSVLMIFVRPFVHIERSHELTGPPDEQVWSMVNSGASLDSIQAEITKTGKDVDDFVWIGGTLLSRSVELNRHDLAEWLLLNGADPNGNGFTPTPLWIAVSMTEDVRMVRLLVDNGADADVDLGDDLTLLDVAKDKDNAEIIEIIETNINSQDQEKAEKRGQTPLIA